VKIIRERIVARTSTKLKAAEEERKKKNWNKERVENNKHRIIPRESTNNNHNGVKNKNK